MVPEEEEVKRLRALRVLRPDKTSPGHKLTLRGHTLQQMADGCLHPDKGEERRGEERKWKEFLFDHTPTPFKDICQENETFT